jgi:WD40 repeat protein
VTANRGAVRGPARVLERTRGVQDPRTARGRGWGVPAALRRTQHHRGTPVTGVTFDAAGRRLATTGADHQVFVLDAVHGKKFAALRGHLGAVAGAAFSPNGHWLVTAGPNSTGLWDLSNAQRLLCSTAQDLCLPPPSTARTSNLHRRLRRQHARLLVRGLRRYEGPPAARLQATRQDRSHAHTGRTAAVLRRAVSRPTGAQSGAHICTRRPNWLEQTSSDKSRASLENRYPSLGGSRVQTLPLRSSCRSRCG